MSSAKTENMTNENVLGKRKAHKIKRPRNAYNFFNQETRQKCTEKLSNTEIMSYVAEEWKKVSDEDKEKYRVLAAQDRERFEQEVKDSGLSMDDFGIKRKKKSKKEQDPNIPKRPLNSYLLYSKDKRAELKKEFPDIAETELRKKMSDAWNELPNDDPVKMKYNLVASNNKKAWEAEKEEYLKSDKHQEWKTANLATTNSI